MMLLLHMLGGGKLTNEFPNGLNQEPCMEAGTLPKNCPWPCQIFKFCYRVHKASISIKRDKVCWMRVLERLSKHARLNTRILARLSQHARLSTRFLACVSTTILCNNLVGFTLVINNFLTLPPKGYRILWLPWGVLRGPLSEIKEGVIFGPMLLYSICFIVFLRVTCKKSARNLKI